MGLSHQKWDCASPSPILFVPPRREPEDCDCDYGVIGVVVRGVFARRGDKDDSRVTVRRSFDRFRVGEGHHHGHARTKEPEEIQFLRSLVEEALEAAKTETVAKLQDGHRP